MRRVILSERALVNDQPPILTPKTCLGQSLTTLKGLVCFYLLLKLYIFELAPGQEAVYSVSLTLPIKNGVKTLVQKRSFTTNEATLF